MLSSALLGCKIYIARRITGESVEYARLTRLALRDSVKRKTCKTASWADVMLYLSDKKEYMTIFQKTPRVYIYTKANKF